VEEIRRILRSIPRGKVTTYKELSLALGWEKGWRKVARMLSANPEPINVPCHRVVCSDGKVGGYKLGVRKKIELLKSEGVEIRNGKVNLKKHLLRLCHSARSL